jgi:DNA-binding NarL/FixJ family response regulator
MISVVIVEDNQELRVAIELLLKGSDGYNCLATFDNAEDAEITLPKLNPDVALVDINLPNKNGIDLINILKPKLPQVQFVIFTVFEDNENIFNALKAGATGYLLKSASPLKILEAITEVNNGGSPMSGQIARKVLGTFCKINSQSKLECSKLSAREQEILGLLSKGYRYKEISGKLFISTETVRTHIRNIYQKLQVESGIEAINKVFGKNL